MKRYQRFSFLGRFALGRHKDNSPDVGGGGPTCPAMVQRAGAAAESSLSGNSLEQAYRELLVENQLLVEANERLHERLSRREKGVEESPEVRELMQAQRNALAERSRQLRELDYENKQFMRERKKLVDENQRLAASLARHMHEIQPLARQGEERRRELALVKAELREKSNELAKLTDRYYQLEARTKPQPQPATAANSSF